MACCGQFRDTPQRVKKASNRQNAVLPIGDFFYNLGTTVKHIIYPKGSKNSCCARHFDLLRKPPPTVSIYADRCGLLVLKPPLTSVSLSKNKFFDRLAEVKEAFKTSKPHPSAYIDTVGGGLRSKSKCLAQQMLFSLLG